MAVHTARPAKRALSLDNIFPAGTHASPRLPPAGGTLRLAAYCELLTPSSAHGRLALPSHSLETPDMPLCRSDSLRCGLRSSLCAVSVPHAGQPLCRSGGLRGGVRSHPRAGSAQLLCFLQSHGVGIPVPARSWGNSTTTSWASVLVSAQTCVAVANACNLMRTARATWQVFRRLSSSSPGFLLPDCGADSRSAEEGRIRPADLSLAYTCRICNAARARPRARASRRLSVPLALCLPRCGALLLPCLVARRTPPMFWEGSTAVHPASPAITCPRLPVGIPH